MAMMWDTYNGYGPGFWIIGPILMFLFFIFVIFVIAWAVRAASGGYDKWHRHGDMPHPSQQSRPLEILKERFAKGEITKEQYEETRKTLASS